MVMPKVPSQSLLDPFTRQDELNLMLINEIRALRGAISGISLPSLQAGAPPGADTPGGFHDYGRVYIKRVSLTAANNKAEVTFPPCNYVQVLCDGKMDGIEIHLQDQSSVAIPLDEMDYVPVDNLTRLFVTNDVVSGRTELVLYLTTRAPLGKHIRASNGVIEFGINVRGSFLDSDSESTPANSTTYWLPSTGYIDLTDYIASSWLIRKETNKPSLVEVHHSIDASNFYKLEGYEIATADFELANWNSIYIPEMLLYAKLKVTTGATGAGQLDTACIAKA